MKLTAMTLAAAVTSVSSATFVEYYAVKTQSTHGDGRLVDSYKVYARFNGATDTILNAFNLDGLNGATMNAFYHQDLSTYASVMTSAFGSWAPSLTGAVANRPFDSYVTVGGIPNAVNGVSADPSWGNPLSWFRPDIPAGQNCGWFAPGGSIMGRVGQAGNTADSVILGQFVVARDFNAGLFNLKIGYNNGVAGSPVQFAESTVFIGTVPTPGAIALLGLAGLAGRRRR